LIECKDYDIKKLTKRADFENFISLKTKEKDERTEKQRKLDKMMRKYQLAYTPKELLESMNSLNKEEFELRGGELGYKFDELDLEIDEAYEYYEA
jgi:hypothetical protein